MKETIERSDNKLFSALPTAARQRIINVSLGWILVAGLEAFAYTILAVALINHWSPFWVCTSAGLAVFVTVIVNRAGYLTGVRLAGDLYSALGHALARTKLSWFDNDHRAQIARIAGQGIPGFMSIPAHQLQRFLHAPLLPACLILGIGYVAGIKTAFAAGILLALSLLAQFFSQRALKRADTKRHQNENQTTAATLEFVDHLELLRSAAGPIGAIERISKRWQAQEKELAKTNLASALAIFVSTLASILPIAGIAGFILLEGETNAILLLAVIVLTGRASAPLVELASAGLSLNDLKASLESLKNTTHAPQLTEPKDPKPAPQHYPLQVKEVTHAPVLNGINTTIPQGSRVRILGPSGSGKSTLLELLMRFDDPESGQITLGEVALSDFSYKELATHIAYVPQEAIVFTGTLADNIRIGNPDASDQKVVEAARQASLNAVIARSDQGIHQSVGQQGSALSGGERQRVTLARALLKGAPILILDEATSALDNATEEEIIENLHSLDATIIFVTHRETAHWQPDMTIDLTN
ncbi:ABC transporter ATP-binding protein [Marinomonas mediterranea]|uniref:ABC transporter ATP-binding protein n=1 Tax=Marinomonas mediterranea TaxID=119864 RepID=UPI002349DAA6|nr:ABC transporter ATP-binding protein [Marinomonas mediterranea]WCN09919.1 ATP-binding cassette domain-containing protein [Marinomonas mediterranea]